MWAATGYGWADALAAAQSIAVHGDVLVLLDGHARGREASIDGWFAERAAAVSDGAMELLLERIH